MHTNVHVPGSGTLRQLSRLTSGPPAHDDMQVSNAAAQVASPPWPPPLLPPSLSSLTGFVLFLSLLLFVLFLPSLLFDFFLPFSFVSID